MKYISYTAAVSTIQRFFADYPNDDILELKYIYEAAGRDLGKREQNKSWLTNKLTHLKHYNLVKPVYSFGERKVLEKVQLTNEGKRALGRIDKTMDSFNPLQRPVTLESIAQDIREFERQNPSIKLDLNITVKHGA